MSRSKGAGSGAIYGVMGLMGALFQVTRNKVPVPRYVTTLETELKKVQALFILVNQNIPEELKFFLNGVNDDLTKYAAAIEAAKKEHETGSIWKRFVRMMKPIIQGLMPALTVMAAVQEVSLESTVYFLLAFVLVFNLIAWAFPDFVEQFHDIWSDQEEKNFERMTSQLARTASELLNFRMLESRRSNPGDASRMLCDHPDAAAFWIQRFGDKKHSVPARRFSLALFDNERPWGKKHRDNDRRLLCDVIVKLIDIDGDGEVTTEDFAHFVRLFGPFGTICHRVEKSILWQPTDGSNLKIVPWFSFSQTQVLQAQSETTAPGTFVVRLSSPGSLTLELLPEDRKHKNTMKFRLVNSVETFHPSLSPLKLDESTYTPGSTGIFFSKDDKELPDAKSKQPQYPGFHFQDTASKDRIYFTNLQDLVKAYPKLLIRPYSDPHQTVFFNVAGNIFQAQLGLFQKHPKGLLARILDNIGHFNGPEDAVFLDRDPMAFEVLLNWYRYGRTLIPPHVIPSLIELEFQYFELPFEHQPEPVTVSNGKYGPSSRHRRRFQHLKPVPQISPRRSVSGGTSPNSVDEKDDNELSTTMSPPMSRNSSYVNSSVASIVAQSVNSPANKDGSRLNVPSIHLHSTSSDTDLSPLPNQKPSSRESSPPPDTKHPPYPTHAYTSYPDPSPDPSPRVSGHAEPPPKQGSTGSHKDSVVSDQVGSGEDGGYDSPPSASEGEEEEEQPEDRVERESLSRKRSHSKQEGQTTTTQEGGSASHPQAPRGNSYSELPDLEDST